MHEYSKEQQRERVRQRVKSANVSGSHTYYPGKENSNYVDRDSFQRVGIYARVSTDNPAQTSSFELQQKYYEDMVSRNPNWTLVKIYSDEGKSGTTTSHRKGFREMMDDATSGKLDLIIVKNISRLARNVVDCLVTIRKLREKKVGILFESEGIYTLNTDCAMALSSQAMVAEQESRVRSRSMETSLRMRLDHGLPLTPELLGFYKDSDGKLRVNPEMADIPKLIFYMYLYGYSTKQIADTLIRLSKKTYLGNINWTANGVARILRNERYCGDVLTRKRYKVFAPDADEQKTFKNNGEKPQSYYRDDHEWIVTFDDFTAVQRIMNNAKYGGASLLPELKVIPEGLLKGFVIVHPKWGSFTTEDYLNACRSIDPDEPEDDMQISAEEGEFDFRKYQVVDFKLFDDQNVPSVTLGKKAITFSQSCIREMKCGNYVELLVHPVKKQLAIRPADMENRYAIQWARGEKDRQVNRGVGCKAFSKMLSDVFKCADFNRFKIYGHIYRDGKTSVCVYTQYDSCAYISKEKYFSAIGTEVEGQILNGSGKCIKAVTGNMGNALGTDYYIEKSRWELTHLTKEQWQTRIEGQMCATGDKLNVTPYEELRKFIKDQLGDLFEE